MYIQSTYFPNYDAQQTFASHLLRTVVGLSVADSFALLQRAGGLHKLAQMSEVKLCTLPGIGKQRAAKIVALTEWSLLLQRACAADRMTIRAPEDVAKLLMLEMSLLEKEELRVVTLDTKHKVQNVEIVYKGSLNQAVIRVAEVFRPAILHNASAVVIAHNHPSGDPTPSPEDVQVTRLLCAMGKGLDIDVYDHLIFACNRFVSLKQQGLGFD